MQAWLYRWREQIAYGVAISLSALVLMGRLPNKPSRHAPQDLEFAVAPEETPPPQPQPQPQAAPTPPNTPATQPLVQPNPVPSPAPARPTPVVQSAAPSNTPSATPSAPVQSSGQPSSTNNAAPPSPTEPQATPAPPQAPAPAPARALSPSSYVAQVLAHAKRVKRYPTSREARLSHPTGTAEVTLTLDRTGRVLSAEISNSSGSNILDSEALKTLRTTHFPSFPEGIYPGESHHTFAIKMQYEINTSNSE